MQNQKMMMAMSMLVMMFMDCLSAPMSSCEEQSPCVHHSVTKLPDGKTCRVYFWWDNTDPDCQKEATLTNSVSHACTSSDEQDKFSDFYFGFENAMVNDVECGQNAYFGVKDGSDCSSSCKPMEKEEDGYDSRCQGGGFCGGGNSKSCKWEVETKLCNKDGDDSNPSNPTESKWPTAKPTKSWPQPKPTKSWSKPTKSWSKPTKSWSKSSKDDKPPCDSKEESTTTDQPTSDPTAKPTTSTPTNEPTSKPTTADPTSDPTARPTTSAPTSDPTAKPTTSDPTSEPTARPTTSDPTNDPTARPTTSDPTTDPTMKPTTSDPTSDPTARPTTSDPTSDPTARPTTSDPTSDPTAKPTTSDPTSDPTAKPTTSDPTSDPTAKPTTSDPTSDPTTKPTTSDPTSDLTVKPTTSDPTSDPTARPTTSDPTNDPTARPTTSDPTSDPTARPTTSDPTTDPTARPTTSEPTTDPTVKPTTSDPTSEPTLRPSLAPTYTVCATDDALNIGFLLDESGSIDYDEWQMVKTFVNRIVTFDISPESYVSLFEYATQESYENFLNWTKADDAGKVVITDAMDSNQWNAAGQTYTWWGTSKALDAIWNYKNSCRDESCTRSDLLFIITDGVPSDEVCPRIEDRVAQSSVDIVLIIIGGAEDADTIEQEIGCLDTDGTDVFKVEEFDSDAFNAIEIRIRAKTCSGEFPAGPEQENDVQYEYCPPEDPVNECTYDLGIGSNVGGGGQGGGADAGVSAAHSQFASFDVLKNKPIAMDYSSYDGVVVMTWSELISFALCVAAIITIAFGLFAVCFCAVKMSRKKLNAHKHVKIDYDTESECDNL